jgi:glycosyltransferase involved in cell wall biosynthesis
MDAISVGLPLVCHNVGSVSEINDFNGYFVEFPQIEKGIELYLNTPLHKRLEMSQNSIKLYIEKFNLDKNLSVKEKIILGD